MLSPTEPSDSDDTISLSGKWWHHGAQQYFVRSSHTTEQADLPVVILVHGLGVSGRYMVPLAEQLAEKHRVFIPDLPGFGQSEIGSRILTIAELADFLAEWMMSTRIDSATLVGNSLGCQVIVELAIRYPQLIERAVLISPTVDRRHRRLVAQLWRGCMDLWREPWSLWSILSSDYLETGAVRLFRTFRHALDDKVESKLPCVTMPALVIHGDRDSIVPGKWAAEVAATLPRGTKLCVAEGTHAVHYSHPHEVAAAIAEFGREN